MLKSSKLSKFSVTPYVPLPIHTHLLYFTCHNFIILSILSHSFIATFCFISFYVVILIISPIFISSNRPKCFCFLLFYSHMCAFVDLFIYFVLYFSVSCKKISIFHRLIRNCLSQIIICFVHLSYRDFLFISFFYVSKFPSTYVMFSFFFSMYSLWPFEKRKETNIYLFIHFLIHM